MPQAQLPLFAEGSTAITAELAFERRDGQVVYFNGQLPVFTHPEKDLASFRFFTTQLIVNGTATQGQIVTAFGVPLTTVKRYVRQYRERGAEAFFKPRARRQGHRLTPERLQAAQALLDAGLGVPEISQRLGLLPSTLHKAIDAGRLRQIKKKDAPGSSREGGAVAVNKSERSVVDGQAALGVATTRWDERLLASLGKLQAAPIQFETVADVPHGGVLCALPALLELGLLRHSREHFALPAGFYPLETIFIAIAFLALARVISLEGLRYEPPGEWGKLLGLDRIPEVRTLREKIQIFCQEGKPVREWSSQLAREWMEESAKDQPSGAGTLYIDGHVRVYHGGLTDLPRRFVARQKLCQRGTTDYWVNAMDGQPFFVVTQASDPGLLKVLEEQIVPRLLKEVPHQPTAAELEADPYRPRFTLIFDRAGYSPEFFARMWAQRIAVITYHKFPEGLWAAEEFSPRQVRLINGQEEELPLAERGVQLSNGMWVREVRHRDERGHQTAMVATEYRRNLDAVAMALFARWCQENFFQYMRRHYGLDRLIEYGTEALPDTTVVVNPAWRQKDQEVRRERAILTRQYAELGACECPAHAEAKAVEAYEQQAGEKLQAIRKQEEKLETLKNQRKATLHHLPIKDLPTEQRFTQLRATKKHFVDTIKLLAYRAETALVCLAREKLAREDDARSLVRQLFDTAADLAPDLPAKTLTVRLHRLTNGAHDAVLEHLCAELNETATEYPGTDLRLVFEPVGTTQIPRDQES